MVANLDLQKVIQAARSGQKLEARKLIATIVKTNPKHAQAWFILSFLVDDQTQQIDCLQRTLKYAPDHIKAQERLQQIKAKSVWQEPSNSSNSDAVPLLTLNQVGLRPDCGCYINLLSHRSGTSSQQKGD